MITLPALPAPLAHAYIITGGSAAARLSYANRMAAAYLCEHSPRPCGQCRHCKKVAADIHPDLSRLTLLEDKREILVDQTRALRSDVFVMPNESDRKVFIIDPADAMNDNAQNSLLKVLEDGPDYAAFLLICANSGKLLSTIRSRCETLTLPPEEEAPDPALEQCAKELATHLLEDDELSLWVFLSSLERQKMKSKELQSLLLLTEGALRPFLHTRPRQCAALLQLLRRCEEQCVFNVGTGHLLGLLMAERPGK